MLRSNTCQLEVIYNTNYETSCGWSIRYGVKGEHNSCHNNGSAHHALTVTDELTVTQRQNSHCG